MFSSVSVRDDVKRIFTAAQRSKGRSPLSTTFLAFPVAMSLDRQTFVGNLLNYPKTVIARMRAQPPVSACVCDSAAQGKRGPSIATEAISAARTPVVRIAELPA